MTQETDLEREDIVSFVDKHKFTFPVGYAANDVMDALGISGIPTYFVFGTDGKLVWSGHSSGSQLGDAIETALQGE